MSTKSSVDLRAELAELVKRKAEIAVSTEAIVKLRLFLINFRLDFHHTRVIGYEQYYCYYCKRVQFYLSVELSV